MTDLALLLLILVLIEAFVIIRFELRFEAYLRTVQTWSSGEEARVNALAARVVRLETLSECRACVAQRGGHVWDTYDGA